jgi:hypothetical protein
MDGSVRPGEPLGYEWEDDTNDLPTDDVLQKYTEAVVTTMPRV